MQGKDFPEFQKVALAYPTDIIHINERIKEKKKKNRINVVLKTICGIGKLTCLIFLHSWCFLHVKSNLSFL